MHPRLKDLKIWDNADTSDWREAAHENETKTRWCL